MTLSARQHEVWILSKTVLEKDLRVVLWHSLGQGSILCVFITFAIPFLFVFLVRSLNQQPM